MASSRRVGRHRWAGSSWRVPATSMSTTWSPSNARASLIRPARTEPHHRAVASRPEPGRRSGSCGSGRPGLRAGPAGCRRARRGSADTSSSGEIGRPSQALGRTKVTLRPAGGPNVSRPRCATGPRNVPQPVRSFVATTGSERWAAIASASSAQAELASRTGVSQQRSRCSNVAASEGWGSERLDGSSPDSTRDRLIPTWRGGSRAVARCASRRPV